MFIYIDDLHYKNVSGFYQIFYLKIRRITLELENCLAAAPIAYQTSGPLPTISQAHECAIALRVSIIERTGPSAFVRRWSRRLRFSSS